MSNGYYSNNPGIDPLDDATDAYLLAQALSEDGDGFVGYADAIEVGNSWTAHPLSPGITEIRLEQRRHRIFLLVNRFRPRTQAEADARGRAIRRYSQKRSGDYDNWNLDQEPVGYVLLIAKIEKGRPC